MLTETRQTFDKPLGAHFFQDNQETRLDSSSHSPPPKITPYNRSRQYDVTLSVAILLQSVAAKHYAVQAPGSVDVEFP